jgi:hypothetical protein
LTAAFAGSLAGRILHPLYVLPGAQTSRNKFPAYLL